jgi:hypothetical protein
MLVLLSIGLSADGKSLLLLLLLVFGIVAPDRKNAFSLIADEAKCCLVLNNPMFFYTTCAGTSRVAQALALRLRG